MPLDQAPAAYVLEFSGGQFRAVPMHPGLSAVTTHPNDAAPVLQAAVNSLMGGGKIYVRSGKYRLGTTVVLSQPVLIEGEGDNTEFTVAVSGGSQNGFEVTAQNVRITRVAFGVPPVDAGADPRRQAGAAIYINTTLTAAPAAKKNVADARAYVRSVLFAGQNECIRVEECGNVHVSECTAYLTRNAFLVADLDSKLTDPNHWYPGVELYCSDVWCQGQWPDTQHEALYGIVIRSGGGFYFSACRFYKHGDGMWIAPRPHTVPGPDRVTTVDWGFFTDCVFDAGNQRGLFIDTTGGQQVRSLFFKDCWFSWNYNCGVVLQSGTGRILSTKFECCKIYLNRYHGVLLNQNDLSGGIVVGTTLSNCDIYNNGWNDVVGGGGSTTPTYDGVHIDRASQFYIRGCDIGIRDKYDDPARQSRQRHGVNLVNSQGNHRYAVESNHFTGNKMSWSNGIATDPTVPGAAQTTVCVANNLR